MILRARIVHPVTGTPVVGGMVVLHGDRISEVGPFRRVAQEPIVDYGDAVILSGLVNAHTHLELGFLAGQVPPSASFADWLVRVVRRLRESPMSKAALDRAVLEGISESLTSGVTLVGDITSTPTWSRAVLAQAEMPAVSFGEVIAVGPRGQRFDSALHDAIQPSSSPRVVLSALSPHAPYTVPPEAMRRTARLARAMNLPLTIHLSESLEEIQWSAGSGGPLVEVLEHLGSDPRELKAAGMSPIELADLCEVLGPTTIAAHANYLSDADVAILARSGTSVAYCPRTHAAFHHGEHPIVRLLAGGVNVCLGTDSLVTTPTLSMLDEVRFLRSIRPDVSPQTILEMATIRGARALGRDAVMGSLEPGKLANLLILPLESGEDWTSILDHPGDPLAVYLNGRAVDLDR